MSEFAKWILIAWLAFGGLVTVAAVGKPRKPLTPGAAVVVVLLTVAEVVLIVAFWGQS